MLCVKITKITFLSIYASSKRKVRTDKFLYLNRINIDEVRNEKIEEFLMSFLFLYSTDGCDRCHRIACI